MRVSQPARMGPESERERERERNVCERDRNMAGDGEGGSGRPRRHGACRAVDHGGCRVESGKAESGGSWGAGETLNLFLFLYVPGPQAVTAISFNCSSLCG